MAWSPAEPAIPPWLVWRWPWPPPAVRREPSRLGCFPLRGCPHRRNRSIRWNGRRLQPSEGVVGRPDAAGGSRRRWRSRSCRRDSPCYRHSLQLLLLCRARPAAGVNLVVWAGAVVSIHLVLMLLSAAAESPAAVVLDGGLAALADFVQGVEAHRGGSFATMDLAALWRSHSSQGIASEKSH